jgi:hypothetical protein
VQWIRSRVRYFVSGLIGNRTVQLNQEQNHEHGNGFMVGVCPKAFKINYRRDRDLHGLFLTGP